MYMCLYLYSTVHRRSYSRGQVILLLSIEDEQGAKDHSMCTCALYVYTLYVYICMYIYDVLRGRPCKSGTRDTIPMLLPSKFPTVGSGMTPEPLFFYIAFLQNASTLVSVAIGHGTKLFFPVLLDVVAHGLQTRRQACSRNTTGMRKSFSWGV